jgi:uncharacterized membrane protein YqjE
VAAPSPEYPPRAARSGLFSHTLEWLTSAWAYLRARLELVTIEGREAGGTWLKALGLLLGSVVVLVFGYFFFCFAIVFAIARAFGGENAWIWVTLGAALVHVGAGALLLLKVRSLVQKPMFQVTLEEFKKDHVWLEATTKKRS